MNDNTICPLCAHKTLITINHSTLKDIVYKYLQITINEECVSNICPNCEKMLINFDRFAHECWAVQRTFEKSFNIKLEGDNKVEIKIEDPEICLNVNFDDNDDSHKNTCSKNVAGDMKIEDPLLNIKNDNEKRSKLRGTINKKVVKNKDDLNISSKRRKTVKRNGKAIAKKPWDIKKTCHVCESEFKFWAKLEQHCLKEHSSKPKVLCVCGEFLTNIRTVQYHRVKHDENKAHKCEQCGKCFAYIRHYEAHMAQHIPEEEYSYSCTVCPKKFPSTQSLDHHIKTHEREKLSCDICGKTYITKHALFMHKKAVHENIRDHICDECGHACASNSALIAHKFSRHSGRTREEKSFACDKCSKTFKGNHTLKEHIESIHLGIRFKCEQCPAVLKNLRNLQLHKLVHTDVFKYFCHLCNKKFKRNNELRLHMRAHKGMKPYVCEWCSVPYANLKYFKLHKKREHSDKCKKQKDKTHSNSCEEGVNLGSDDGLNDTPPVEYAKCGY